MTDNVTLFGTDAYGFITPDLWNKIEEGAAFLSHGAPLNSDRYISTHLGEIGFRLFGADTVFLY